MTDIDRFDQRLSAVERVVVDNDVAVDELAELSSLAETVSDLEAHVEEQERRIADLEAAVQSIEGYVGNVESTNDDVERQAASAVATVDRLEGRVEALEVELDDVHGGVLEGGPESGPELESKSDTEPSEIVKENGEIGESMATETGMGTRAGTGSEPEGSVFEFGTGASEGATPESAVDEIGGGDTASGPTVDDGMGRPVSTANQSAVDSALDEGESDAVGRGGDEKGPEERRSETETGLLDSLRARLS
ncbi:DUF7310 family coiled-coil domain-containing protein [Natronoglomus mannanivorans]|uniref:DUF7310 domain-containing protein n=1 Tax=Natronoglomus mannanivorans TaxID=2979990 RepID=A0AAP2YX32_9EURY|nr:hypothetical protein [Halobacteria archaeon AArc-xg1-1]